MGIDFKKLLDKAKKNCLQQQEKFRTVSSSLADLRTTPAPEVKKAEKNVVTKSSAVTASTSSLASSISAIRNNHLKNVAKKVENIKKAKEIEERKKAAAAMLSKPQPQHASSVPKIQTSAQKTAPAKKAAAPALDFQKLMEVAQHNTSKVSKGGTSLQTEVNGILKMASASQKQLPSFRKSAPSAPSSSTTKQPQKKPLPSNAPNFQNRMKIAKTNVNTVASASSQRISTKKAVTAQSAVVRKTSATIVRSQSAIAKPTVKSSAITNGKKPPAPAKPGAVSSLPSKSSQIGQRPVQSGGKQNKVPDVNNKTKPVTSSATKTGPLLPHLQKKPAAVPVARSKSYDQGRNAREKPLLPFLEQSLPAKRKQIPSYEEEEDSDLDGFIVSDDEVDEAEDLPSSKSVSAMIREITGYDPSQFVDDDDDDCRNMEASFKEIAREEAISAKLGLKEDLEDMRLEQEKIERKKKKMALAKKMKLSA